MPLMMRGIFVFIITSKEKRGEEMTATIVKGAPGYYLLGSGILTELPDLLKDISVSKYHIITGKKAWQAVQPYLPKEVIDNNIHLHYIDGHTTLKKVHDIQELLTNDGANGVIGIGGGTALDITKAVAIEASVQSILIPTIAATCAAWTPLSVYYNEEGSFTHYTEFPIATTLVLIEPEIIAKAPITYLKAGIGDTLAKFYEAEALIESLYHEKTLPVPKQVSQFSAKICRDTLLNDGEAALQSVAKNETSPALIRVIETIIMTGGMVGGFGEKAGRIAGAHSLHNGLTVANAAKDFLHGELVAYGILGQLAIEEKWTEVDYLLPFYESWQLPSSLSTLNIDVNDEQLMKTIVKKAIRPTESIHFMKNEISEQSVLQALRLLEKQNEQKGVQTS